MAAIDLTKFKLVPLEDQESSVQGSPAKSQKQKRVTPQMLTKGKLQGGKKGTSRGRDNPADSSIVYRGPILGTPQEANDTVSAVVLMHRSVTYTASSGTIAGFVPTDPSNATDWAAWQSAWSEYRTLGIRLELHPKYPYSNAGTQPTDTWILMANDHVQAASPTAATDLTGRESCRMYSLGGPKLAVCEWHMAGTEEAQYVDTLNPTNVGGVEFWGDGFGASATIQGFVTWKVQFRGKA